jgi:hypothetical protein
VTKLVVDKICVQPKIDEPINLTMWGAGAGSGAFKNQLFRSLRKDRDGTEIGKTRKCYKNTHFKMTC